jgi:hypothetical protein
LNLLLVQTPIHLRPGPPDRWPLRSIQHSELNPGSVSGDAHQAVKGVDFPDQSALAQTANRWIATHLADGFLGGGGD